MAKILPKEILINVVWYPGPVGREITVIRPKECFHLIFPAYPTPQQSYLIQPSSPPFDVDNKWTGRGAMIMINSEGNLGRSRQRFIKVSFKVNPWHQFEELPSKDPSLGLHIAYHGDSNVFAQSFQRIQRNRQSRIRVKMCRKAGKRADEVVVSIWIPLLIIVIVSLLIILMLGFGGGYGRSWGGHWHRGSGEEGGGGGGEEDEGCCCKGWSSGSGLSLTL